MRYGRIGPTTAFALMQLWMEGKHSASLSELETWESVVMNFLTDYERKMNAQFGPDVVPDYVVDPTDD